MKGIFGWFLALVSLSTICTLNTEMKGIFGWFLALVSSC